MKKMASKTCDSCDFLSDTAPTHCLKLMDHVPNVPAYAFARGRLKALFVIERPDLFFCSFHTGASTALEICMKDGHGEVLNHGHGLNYCKRCRMILAP